MRHSPNTHRLATAAVIAGGAIGLLAGPGPASAVVPGSNGLIAMSKCEDGPSCNVLHIWTMDPTSGAEHQVTSGASYDDDPAFSPDGTRIAFQHCPPNAQCRISIVDAGGGTVTDLTPGTYFEDYPAFSPDGTKIVFKRDDPVHGGSHLVVMDTSGGNERLLTSDTNTDRMPSWSPDGSTVVFQRSPSGTPGFRIYKVAANGGTPVPLTAGPDDRAPSFSLDGTHIAFRSGDAIEIMDANGGNLHALTAPPTGSTDNEPAFSPDGTEIIFERWMPLTDTSPLMAMNLDGSNVHAITGLSERLFRPDWQPLPAPTPAGSGPQAAPAADTTAPALTLRAPKRESVRKGRLYVLATSNEAGTGSAGGSAAIRHRARRYRLGSSTRGVAADARTKVWVKIPRKPLRAIRAALARHERATATIAVGVRDGAGNATRKAVRIRLDK